MPSNKIDNVYGFYTLEPDQSKIGHREHKNLKKVDEKCVNLQQMLFKRVTQNRGPSPTKLFEGVASWWSRC